MATYNDIKKIKIGDNTFVFHVPTSSEVGAAASSHAHGNITSGGDITATAPTIASGDQLIINDNSASKITNGPTFDGSTTTTALTPKGTWETFLKSYSVAEDTSGTVYNIVLNTATSSSFNPHRDTDGKYDDDATASGLYYQSAVLYTPALVVGDLDYTITTEDYDSIDSMLESLNV